MDSLTSIELRNRLQASLECSLSQTLAFDYPTLTTLVDYLGHEVYNPDIPPPEHNVQSASEAGGERPPRETRYAAAGRET